MAGVVALVLEYDDAGRLAAVRKPTPGPFAGFRTLEGRCSCGCGAELGSPTQRFATHSCRQAAYRRRLGGLAETTPRVKPSGRRRVLQRPADAVTHYDRAVVRDGIASKVAAP